MPYTAEQEREFKVSFASRRRRQYWIAIPFFVVILALALASDQEAVARFGIPPSILGPAMLVLVAGLLVFSFRNWRCPACNSYLGRGMNPRFCTKCGVALQ